MSDLRKRFAASARKALLDTAPAPAPLPGGAFAEVITDFVEAIKEEYPFLDAKIRDNIVDPNLFRITVWPKFRSTESVSILTLWATKVDGKDAMSVLGSREVVFSSPEALADHLERLFAQEDFREMFKDIKDRYDGDADGMLRSRYLDRMVAGDLALILPHDQFLLLAEATTDQDFTVRARLFQPERYNPNIAYQYLTSSGYVIEIIPGGITVEKDAVVVTGKKQIARALAA